MPITWRNIEAPDFRQAQLGVAAANESIQDALAGIRNIGTEQREIADANLASATDAFTQRAEEQLLASTRTTDDLDKFDFSKFADEVATNPVDRDALHDLFLTRADALRQEELDKLQMEAQKVGIERDKIGIKQAKGDLLEQQRNKLINTLNQGVASVVDQGQRSGLTDAEITNNVRDYLAATGQKDGQDYSWFLPTAMQTRNTMLTAATSLTDKQQSIYQKEVERNKQEAENLINLEKAAFEQELKKLPTLDSIQAEESLDMYASPNETISKLTTDGFFTADAETNINKANNMFESAQATIRGDLEKDANKAYQKFLDDNKLTSNSPQAIKYRTETLEPALQAARTYVLPNTVKNQTIRLLPKDAKNGRIYFPFSGPKRIQLVRDARKQVQSMEENVDKRIALQAKHQQDVQKRLDEQVLKDSAALEAAKLR
ncbi:hypothetical protein [Vibrio phage PhiImVa-1]|nr:hypothetical protein [Vibrio phage PhiImVa-1]